MSCAQFGAEVVAGDLRKPADCAAFCEGAKGRGSDSHGWNNPSPARERFLRHQREGYRGTSSKPRSRAAGSGAWWSSPPTRRWASIHIRTQLFDESSPYHPYMNYGRSKMQMELAVKELRAGPASKRVIIRPPWFYGPGQPPRQTLFFTMIRTARRPSSAPARTGARWPTSTTSARACCWPRTSSAPRGRSTGSPTGGRTR